MLVGSLTAAEAEEAIRRAMASSNLIRHPQLTIRTLEHKTHTIYVIGAVKTPGAYELQPDDCDPLRAIVAAGGTTEDATSIVEVRRGGKQNSLRKDSVTTGTNPAEPQPDGQGGLASFRRHPRPMTKFFALT